MLKALRAGNNLSMPSIFVPLFRKVSKILSEKIRKALCSNFLFLKRKERDYRRLQRVGLSRFTPYFSLRKIKTRLCDSLKMSIHFQPRFNRGPDVPPIKSGLSFGDYPPSPAFCCLDFPLH